jgi:hypothetical protein
MTSFDARMELHHAVGQIDDLLGRSAPADRGSLLLIQQRLLAVSDSLAETPIHADPPSGVRPRPLALA